MQKKIIRQFCSRKMEKSNQNRQEKDRMKQKRKGSGRAASTRAFASGWKHLLIGVIVCLAGAVVCVGAVRRGTTQAAGKTTGTIYVNFDSKKSQANGSVKYPFKTIETALKHVRPGMLVLVSGTSTRPIVITGVHGTSGADITIRAAAGKASVKGGTIKETTALVTFYDCSYIRFEDFTVKNLKTKTTKADAIGVCIYGDSESTGHIEIKDCDISGIDCSGAYPAKKNCTGPGTWNPDTLESREVKTGAWNPADRK